MQRNHCVFKCWARITSVCLTNCPAQRCGFRANFRHQNWRKRIGYCTNHIHRASIQKLSVSSVLHFHSPIARHVCTGISGNCFLNGETHRSIRNIFDLAHKHHLRNGLRKATFRNGGGRLRVNKCGGLRNTNKSTLFIGNGVARYRWVNRRWNSCRNCSNTANGKHQRAKCARQQQTIAH